MTFNTIYISLGTNLGQRESNLQAALKAFSPGIQTLKQSPLYQTKPWGYADQPDFLNQVVKAQTKLSPLELLDYLKEIEERVGRTPTFRYGPRIVDLDILFYDDLIFENERLIIPHPRLAERAFVLVPLSKIAPNLCHPVRKNTIQELLSQVDQSGVELYTPL